MRYCVICGTSIPRPRKATQTTCSIVCRGAWVAQSRGPTRAYERACSVCGAPVPGTAGRVVYCDACRHPARACSECGTEFQAKSRRSARQTCSAACQYRLRARRTAPTGADSPFWKGGHRGYRGPGWPAIRDRIRDRDGWACQECGATRAAGARLDVHHLVPAEDWANPGAANDDANLLTLCVDCHAQRHWDGSWRDRRVPPEQREERRQATRAANYERNREKRIADATRWNQENRERRNARERARRAEKRAAKG